MRKYYCDLCTKEFSPDFHSALREFDIRHQGLIKARLKDLCKVCKTKADEIFNKIYKDNMTYAGQKTIDEIANAVSELIQEKIELK